MQIRDPLPDWSEPDAVRQWGDQCSPRIDSPHSAYIECYVHPDVVSVVGRFLLPAFVEHDGGVFFKERFRIDNYLSWKKSGNSLSAIESVMNHRHMHDLFDLNQEWTEKSFVDVAYVMAQALRVALHFSFPGRHFNVFVSIEGEEDGPVVGFHSVDPPLPDP